VAAAWLSDYWHHTGSLSNSRQGFVDAYVMYQCSMKSTNYSFRAALGRAARAKTQRPTAQRERYTAFPSARRRTSTRGAALVRSAMIRRQGLWCFRLDQLYWPATDSDDTTFSLISSVVRTPEDSGNPVSSAVALIGRTVRCNRIHLHWLWSPRLVDLALSARSS